MQKTIAINTRRAALMGLTVLLVMALGIAVYGVSTDSDLLSAFLGERAVQLLGRPAGPFVLLRTGPDTRVAEKLATAEANGELYEDLEAYTDLVTPELMRKLHVTAAQALPQMQAVNFQSRLVSIEGIEVEEMEDGQYRILVHGQVEVQGEGIPQQIREGTAIVIMDKVDGRWLATDYRSLGSK